MNELTTKDTKGTKHFEPLTEREQRAAKAVFQAGLSVHKTLGPGLLESTYETCLAFELERAGFDACKQVPLPVVYDGVKLDAGYRIDLLVEDSVIVEVKSVDALAPIHEAQILTYMKLSGRRLGLLLNFNVILFKDGVRRFIR